MSRRQTKAAASVRNRSANSLQRRQEAALKQSQKALKDTQTELALLTAHGTDTIYRLRYATMRYDYLSPAIERLLGYSAAEFSKMNIRDVIEETRIVPNAMQKVLEFAPFEEARRKGEVMRWHADYRMRTKDGRHIWVSDVSHPWLDEQGAIIGSVGCLRDITERVEAEQQFQEEMMRMANMDWLTGVHHRRFFFDRLDEEIRRVRRSRADLSIAIIDIDHFKTINDRHGHHAGDVVLQQVAARIGTCLRDTDILARVGGEEFALLLPETPLEGAYWVAERIRHAIAAEPLQLPDSPPLRVTVSIGVAEADFEEPQDSTVLYRTADTRLYIAKNMGRNQVSVDELLSLH